MASNPASSRLHITLDIAGLTAIAANLVFIHFLTPPALQQALTFDHADPQLHALLTAAYVHGSDAHLSRNLAGFALTAGYTYWLCLYSDGRQWFWRTIAAYLVVLPVLVSVTSWVVFHTQFPSLAVTSRGFSGVVAGYGGMLLVALTRFVRAKFNRDLGQAVGIGVFLVLMQLLDLRYQGGASPVVSALVLAGLGLAGSSYVREHGLTSMSVTRRQAAISGGIISLVVGVLAVVVLGLFPSAAALTQGGTLTNVYAHAAGFGWGLVLAWGLSIYEA